MIAILTINSNKVIQMQNYTFLFLEQFKAVDTKAQICPELEVVGLAAKHVVLVVLFLQSLLSVSSKCC